MPKKTHAAQQIPRLCQALLVQVDLIVRHDRIWIPALRGGVCPYSGHPRLTKKAPTRAIGAHNLAGFYRACGGAEGSTSSSIFRRHTVPLSN